MSKDDQGCNEIRTESQEGLSDEVRAQALSEDWRGIWQLKAQLYSFLGNSLLKPLSEDVSTEVLNPCFWQNFPLLPANRQMEEALADLVDCTEELQQLSRADAQTTVNVEFTRLFIGPGRPSAPPWESLYREGAVTLFGRPTQEMRALYHSKGLKIERPGKQLEDHLGLELLFLAHCAENVVDAAEQLGFIRKHLLWWIPQLLDKAAAAKSAGYYPALIKLTWGILLWDEDLLTEYLQSLDPVLSSSNC